MALTGNFTLRSGLTLPNAYIEYVETAHHRDRNTIISFEVYENIGARQNQVRAIERINISDVSIEDRAGYFEQVVGSEESRSEDWVLANYSDFAELTKTPSVVFDEALEFEYNKNTKLAMLKATFNQIRNDGSPFTTAHLGESKYFSLESFSIDKWLGLWTATIQDNANVSLGAQPLIAYPKEITSKDGTITQLANNAELQGYMFTMMGWVETLDRITEAKRTAIQACTAQEELDLITDESLGKDKIVSAMVIALS